MARPNTREQLIQAGMQTLFQQGFNATTIQDITDAAQVPKGSFYNHFESKEALAEAALERFWELGEERRATLRNEALDPVERLRQHFQQLTDAIVRGKFSRGCLIGNFSSEMAGNDQLRAQLSSVYANWTRQVADCVQEADRQGRVVAKLPAAAVAGFLVTAWEGAVLRAKVERQRLPLDEFHQVAFSAIFS